MGFDGFPGQIEELKRLARLGLDAERRSRRQLVASAVGMMLIGAGGFWLGRRSAASDARGLGEAADPSATDRTAFLRSRLPLARKLADASDSDLRASHATFLSILGVATTEDTLWHGFDRLAAMAVSTRDTDLARALLQAAAVADLPESSRAWLEQVRVQAR